RSAICCGRSLAEQCRSSRRSAAGAGLGVAGLDLRPSRSIELGAGLERTLAQRPVEPLPPEAPPLAGRLPVRVVEVYQERLAGFVEQDVVRGEIRMVDPVLVDGGGPGADSS